jgi:hypothetical protein
VLMSCTETGEKKDKLLEANAQELTRMYVKLTFRQRFRVVDTSRLYVEQIEWLGPEAAANKTAKAV